MRLTFEKLFFLISILAFSNLLKAQELPEIPLKNGMAYYSFEHKLDNTKKCLSLYFNSIKQPYESITILRKASNYSSQLAIKQSGVFKSISFIVSPPMILDISKSIKCNDTLKNSTGIHLIKSGELLWRPAVIEFFRKKTITSEIIAQVEIIFTSKTEYKLAIKDLSYKFTFQKGFKPGIDIYNIGELYEQIKASGNITKSDIRFFENLNFFMQSADEIILKALTETYKADEL